MNIIDDIIVPEMPKMIPNEQIMLFGKGGTGTPSSGSSVFRAGLGEGAIQTKYTKSLTKGSLSAGIGNTVGAKGFYIENIDFNKKYIYLCINIDPDLKYSKPSILEWGVDYGDEYDETIETDGYEVGDRFCIYNSKSYPFCGTISEIVGNRIKYEGELPFTGIRNDMVGEQRWRNWDADHIFFVPTKPEVGHILTYLENNVVYEMFQNSAVFGLNNTGSGEGVVIGGVDNIAIDDHVAIFGRRNIGAYGSIVGGTFNTGTGYYNIIGGRDNNDNGQQAVVMAGKGLIANAYYQVLAGRYNKVDDTLGLRNPMLVIGGGTSDTDRKTVLVASLTGELTTRGNINTYGTLIAQNNVQAQNNITAVRDITSFQWIRSKVGFCTLHDNIEGNHFVNVNNLSNVTVSNVRNTVLGQTNSTANNTNISGSYNLVTGQLSGIEVAGDFNTLLSVFNYNPEEGSYVNTSDQYLVTGNYNLVHGDMNGILVDGKYNAILCSGGWNRVSTNHNLVIGSGHQVSGTPSESGECNLVLGVGHTVDGPNYSLIVGKHNTANGGECLAMIGTNLVTGLDGGIDGRLIIGNNAVSPGIYDNYLFRICNGGVRDLFNVDYTGHVTGTAFTLLKYNEDRGFRHYCNYEQSYISGQVWAHDGVKEEVKTHMYPGLIQIGYTPLRYSTQKREGTGTGLVVGDADKSSMYDYCVTIGTGHKMNGQYNLAVGLSHDFNRSDGTAAKHSLLVGRGLKAGSWYQLVTGRFNNPVDSAPLVVGWGTSDTVRKNIFVVSGTGDAILEGNLAISGTPTKDGHVATLKWVKDYIAAELAKL